MTPEPETSKDEIPAESAGGQPKATGKQRRKTVQFIVLFVVYVFTLLVGYRYALGSEFNMWYLFQTAKHTSALLGFIGESSEVEPIPPYQSDGWKREQLEAWRNGDASVANAGTEDSNGQASNAPLTAYERWLYNAYKAKHNDMNLDESGPMVDFVAAPGLNTKIQRTRQELHELNSSTSTEDASTDEKRQRLEEQLSALEKERQAVIEESDKSAFVLRDKSFRFVLVPDCGAIEVMSIFVAAVAAFPTLIRRRLLGLALGIPVLYGINLVRLASLAYLAAYDPTADKKWFTFGHEYVWQAVFIIFVVVVWLCWIEFIVQRRQT